MSSVDPDLPNFPFEGARRSYDIGELLESAVDHDPFVQLRRWLDDATDAGVAEPTAMTVATLGAGERVHSRTVLLRRLTAAGLVFFTNRDSAKGEQLAAHPQCAAQFLWLDLHRQVRVEGRAMLLDDREADEYFAGRPRGSQLGAWASPQSQVLRDRADLERRVAAVEERFAGAERVPRPQNWGGYRIEPDLFEFWQGRPSRLHDRLRYRLDPDGHWKLDRLAP
jgi:pyridoxamine 5'-phosphate oxidase